MSSNFLLYATSAISVSRLDTCLRNDNTARSDHVCLQQRSTTSQREQRILTLTFEIVASESFREVEIGDEGARWVRLCVATAAPVCAGLANVMVTRSTVRWKIRAADASISRVTHHTFSNIMQTGATGRR